MNRVMVALGLLCLGAIGCGGNGMRVMQEANVGAPANTGFSPHQLASGAHTKYCLFVPHNYTPSQKWPVIVYLHGLGEASSDGVTCVCVGFGPALAQRARTFPFIAIFPQSEGDWKISRPESNDVPAIIDEVASKYSIDPNRVILTGMSTGGEGAWALGARYNDRWAAVVAVCAWSDADAVPNLTKFPVRAYHADVDPLIWSTSSRGMVSKINEAGGKAEFFSKGMLHNCWDPTYNDDELYAWMLQQYRGKK